jgi:proton-coupled amino acid transporter
MSTRPTFLEGSSRGEKILLRYLFRGGQYHTTSTLASALCAVTMFTTSAVSRVAPTARARPSGRGARPSSPLVAAARVPRAVEIHHAFGKRVPCPTAVAIATSATVVSQHFSRPQRRCVITHAASAATPAPVETGETAAVVNTIKAIFGAGGFSLPWAFAQGGVGLVTGCLLASYVFALEALKMLVKAQEVLVAAKVVNGQEDVQTYAGLTGAALGPAGDVLCKALNVVTCFGISVGYMIFVSETMISMLPAATAASYTTAKMIIASLPLWVALSWQRSFKGVNLISLLGTVSVAIGMLWVTFVAATAPAFGANMQVIPMANPAAFSGFFGTVAFLFFIHFTLFGVQEGMPDKSRFVPAVSKAFGLAMVVSAAFGLVGAWGFGPGVKSVVITMLDGYAGLAVKTLLVVNLLFTFPLMARSCLNICENTVAGGKDVSLPVSLATRAAFVTSAAALASIVPNFGTVLGYVGGFCCCAMTLAMPPVILRAALLKAGTPAVGFEKTKIYTVCVVGLVCMVLAVAL